MLIYNISSLLTMVPSPANSLGVINDVAIEVENGQVSWVGPLSMALSRKDRGDIDAGGGVVLPGFVDCHTHLVFAGSRREDFVRRARGESYQQIMQAGGGILSTVEAVRRVSLDELVELALPRLKRMLARGVTSIEAKSGYGLDLPSELKILEAIGRLNQIQPIEISATFMGAHAVPAGTTRASYVEHIINELIPAVAEQGVATACDVFVENGAFSVPEARRILQAAKDAGFLVRVHAEQLSRSGGAMLAAEMGAVSASHLEFASDEDIAALAQAGVVAEVLPIAQDYLGGKVATPARKMADAGVTVAVATDFNPGTAMCDDLHLAMRLAVTRCGLSCEEAIHAATYHAARALGREDIGQIAVGKKADLVILRVSDASELLYDWSLNPVKAVIKGGNCFIGGS